MKLMNVFAATGLREKSRFLSFLDKVCTDAAEKDEKVRDKINKIDGELKNAKYEELKKLFDSVYPYFRAEVQRELSLLGAQYDVLTNILTRDGNCVARIEWIRQLFLKEVKQVSEQSEEFLESIGALDTKKFDANRTYLECFRTAFENDLLLNLEQKISFDERTILNTLAAQLNIIDEDRIALENIISPIETNKIADLLSKLRDIGLIFIVEKTKYIYIPDEMVDLLNEIKNKDLKDKYILRILRTFCDAELSRVYRAHNRRIRGVTRIEKIQGIIKMGISIDILLGEDMHLPDATLTERKNRLKILMDDLDINPDRLGLTLEERIGIIVDELYAATDYELKILIMTAYEDMFNVLCKYFEGFEDIVRTEFEIEKYEALDVKRLRMLSISPFDLLYLIPNDDMKKFCDSNNISKRGNFRLNILLNFVNARDKYIEQYEALASRDFNKLQLNGLNIKEAEIGSRFEETTRLIFEELGLNVDEDLRKDESPRRGRADMIISLNETDIIIGEIKSNKSGEHKSYAGTSRQVKSYARHYERLGKKVLQVLVVAPSFTDEFIRSSKRELEVNISLIEADGLKKILDAFKSKRNPNFSENLLMKGGLLEAEDIANII